MKKYFLMILFACFCTYAEAQDIIVNQQNSNQNSESTGNVNGFQINGISSKEDIGGVETDIIRINDMGGYQIQFTNYNSIMVTVAYLVDNEYTGTIVLKPEETKYARMIYRNPKDVKSIVRRMAGEQKKIF